MFLEVILEDRLVCYVTSLILVQHDVDCKFFNCQLKYGGKQYVNGVVFSPEKIRIVKKYSDDKNPLKISNYSIGNRYWSTSLEKNNETFFKDVSKPNFEPDQGKENEIASLGNSNNIAAEQLITVKGKIINLTEAKVVLLMKLFESGRSIFLIPQEYQSCFCGRRVANSLWTVVLYIYIFSHFTIKVRGRSRYLNSLKMGGSSITPTDAYKRKYRNPLSQICFTKKTHLIWWK